MHRAARASVAALALIATFARGTNASAQALPRIHITALGMHADRPSVAPGETYHVTIHVHVRERRDRLDELQLPSLTNAIDLGDERRRVPAPGGGTDFYEIMTVSSSDGSDAEFTPAYIDAIDPSSNRALRFSSQALRVRVTSPSTTLDRTTRAVGDALHALVATVVALVAAVALGAAALALVFARRARRRRAAAVPTPIDPPTRADPVRPGDVLRDAVAAFRARGDDASLDALRNVLFARAGAHRGATLADALRTLAGRDLRLARAMAIAERVRFGPAHERATAVRDLNDALETVVS